MAGVVIPITGDSSSLVAASAKADAALATLGKAADDAGKKVKDATGGTTNLGTSAQKAAAALGPLGGVLSKISPEAGAAASSIAGLASAANGLKAAGLSAGIGVGSMMAVLGPIAVAVAALGAAYYVLSQNLADVDAANQRAADTSTAAYTELEKLHKLEARLADSAALATGAQSAKEQQLAKDVAEVTAAFGPRLDAAKAQLAAEEKARAAYGGTGGAVEHLRAVVDGLNTEQGKALQNAAKTAVLEPKKAAAIKGTAHAVDTLTQALKDAKAADLDLATSYGALGKSEGDKAYDRTMADLDAKEAAIRKVGALTKEQAAELAALRDQASTDAADAYAADVTARQAAAAQVAKDEEDAMDARSKRAQEYRDAQKDAEDKARATRIANENQITSALIGLGDSLVSATTRNYDTTTKAGREAAMHQFTTQKAIKLAEIAVTGAQAMVQAIGSAPPPLNIPAIIATGAGVAAEVVIAASAQPKFHAGTTGLRPDERVVTAQVGEGIVTSQGMSKPGMKEAVAAANAGQSPTAAPPQAVFQFRHKFYNRFMRENLRAGGPLADRFTLGKKIGHREAR